MKGGKVASRRERLPAKTNKPSAKDKADKSKDKDGKQAVEAGAGGAGDAAGSVASAGQENKEKMGGKHERSKEKKDDDEYFYGDRFVHSIPKVCVAALPACASTCLLVGAARG